MKPRCVAELMPHQTHCINQLIANYQNGAPGTSLCTTYGSGKTLITIQASQIIRGMLCMEDCPALVVTQLSTKASWENNGLHYSPPLNIQFVGGGAQSSSGVDIQNWYSMKGADIIVTNYEMLAISYNKIVDARQKLLEDELRSSKLSPYDRKLVERCLRLHLRSPAMHLQLPTLRLQMKERVNSLTPAASVFFLKVWPVVIFDEAHTARTMSTTWFAAASKLQARFKIPATATPFNNNISDLIALFGMAGISPDLYKPTEQASSLAGASVGFVSARECAHDYCKLLNPDQPCAILSKGRSLPTDSSPVVTADITERWENLRNSGNIKLFCNTLMNLRDRFIIQDSDDEAANHYREQNIVFYAPFATPEEAQLYQCANSGDSHVGSLSKSRLACSGIYHLKDVPESLREFTVRTDDERCCFYRPTKISMVIAVMEIVVARHERALIFTENCKSVEMIATAIQTHFPGRIALQANSETVKVDQRKALLSQFEDNSATCALVTTNIFSEGVNIPCANWVINYDEQWNSVRAGQNFGRVKRPTQTLSVFSVQFIICNTIEEQMWMVKMCKERIGQELMRDVIGPDSIKRITQLEADTTFNDQCHNLGLTSFEGVGDAIRQKYDVMLTAADLPRIADGKIPATEKLVKRGSLHTMLSNAATKKRQQRDFAEAAAKAKRTQYPVNNILPRTPKHSRLMAPHQTRASQKRSYFIPMGPPEPTPLSTSSSSSLYQHSRASGDKSRRIIVIDDFQ